jgi:hypothetical protein
MENSPTTEKLVFCVSTHWMKYVPNALKNNFLGLIGVSLLITSLIAALEAVSIITFFCGGALILYAHHHLFHKLMSESMYDIFVTTERVIYFDDRLFLSNNEHEVPLHRIAGIEADQQGLIQNIFDYGTLWIDTGGSTVDLKRSIPLAPHPEDLTELIAQLVHNEDSHKKS